MSTIGKDSTLKHVSSSPHLRDSITTGGVMFNVIIGLIPLTIVGIGHFGLSSALVIITSILSCMVTEYVFDLICHMEFRPFWMSSVSVQCAGSKHHGTQSTQRRGFAP